MARTVDTQASLPRDSRVRVVVATTVLLTFTSFRRAAAIVLADLGSTAFYVGGIVEQAIGKSAPWFILGVITIYFWWRNTRGIHESSDDALKLRNRCRRPLAAALYDRERRTRPRESRP